MSSHVGIYPTAGLKVPVSAARSILLPLSPHAHISPGLPYFATGFAADDGLLTKRAARSTYHGLHSANPLLLTGNSLRVSMTNLEISVLE